MDDLQRTPNPYHSLTGNDPLLFICFHMQIAEIWKANEHALLRSSLMILMIGIIMIIERSERGLVDFLVEGGGRGPGYNKVFGHCFDI